MYVCKAAIILRIQKKRVENVHTNTHITHTHIAVSGKFDITVQFQLVHLHNRMFGIMFAVTIYTNEWINWLRWNWKSIPIRIHTYRLLTDINLIALNCICLFDLLKSKKKQNKKWEFVVFQFYYCTSNHDICLYKIQQKTLKKNTRQVTASTFICVPIFVALNLEQGKPGLFYMSKQKSSNKNLFPRILLVVCMQMLSHRKRKICTKR